MSGDLRRWLDDLDAAREKATPGPWGAADPAAHGINVDARTSGDGYTAYTRTCTATSDADAELIVAAINAAPKLTAAIRAVLELADQFEAEAEVREVRARTYPPSGAWALDHNRLIVRADTFRRAATRLRATLPAALEPDPLDGGTA